ncbi:MAG: TerD family protein [Desulfuromonadaceae bacterium]
MGISLEKGQKISLEKSAGGSLAKIIMGLGWDAKKTKGFLGFGGKEQSIDLDASCVLFDENKKMIDSIWFKQLKSLDGSIVHTGDNRTGDGDGDDEQIIVDLTRVPAQVKTIMFVVNSFTGQNFSEIENAFCRIVNHANNVEIARYNLSCNGSHTAMLMAKVYRHNNEWKMHALGENCSGKTFEALMPAMQANS